MLSPGVILNDRYRLDDRVATGGMGDVWSATDTLLKRRVAVKVLLPALISDTEFITRFRTEARMMAALRHPGIVAVYDYGENAMVDGRRMDYLVMEYIDGVPLSKRIKAAGRLGVAETLSVVAQAAQALHVAHNAGIVHRDVKPSNLLVQPDGSVVLVDFGVARSAHMTSITSTNIVLGSAHYMAPEQIAGRPVSAATDVYALGAVAYCCLTGRPPFTGGNPLHVVTQHLQDEPPTLPMDIPAPVAMLVSRALAKEPADRYPSAAAFAEAARATQAAASAPPMAVPLPPIPFDPGSDTVAAPSTAAGNRRRNVALAGVAGVVTVALLGLVALLAFRPGPGEPSADPTKVRVGASASGDTGADVEGTEPAVQATASAGPNPSAGTPVVPGGSPTRPSEPAGTANPNPNPTTPRTGPAPKNPYSPGQVCGSGYAVIDSAALKRSDGTVSARVYLLYNAGNGNNCTVALKATSVGTATSVSAYLEVQGASRRTDSGSYAYYAGPVRAKATGVCVKWGGSAGGASYQSPFEHCD